MEFRAFLDANYKLRTAYEDSSDWYQNSPTVVNMVYNLCDNCF